MKKMLLLFLFFSFACKPIFSQALQAVTSVYSDGKYLRLVKSNGQIVHVAKKSVKLERSSNMIILFDNSLSDHKILNTEVTKYGLSYTTVTVPSAVSAAALLTALIALINS